MHPAVLLATEMGGMMGDQNGPLPEILTPLAWCAARVYGAGARYVDRRHRLRGATRVPVPVISVGNLTVGGTGKTPFTKRLAESIIAAGGRPAIALRGYRAKSTGGSDEAREYRDSLPDVPVLVGADRIGSIVTALEASPGSFDCVLLDDGFQHRRLHRDLDIALVDSSRPGLFGDLLPNGWLREPACALSRADCVVLTNHTGEVVSEPLDDLLRRIAPGTPDIRCHHAWSEVLVHGPAGVRSLAPGDAALQNQNVLVVSGLGNPEALIRSVTSHGFTVTHHLRQRDHAAYTDADGRNFVEQASCSDAILTTPKDWVKLRDLGSMQSSTVPVLVPQVRIEFSSGDSELSGKLSEACGRPIAL